MSAYFLGKETTTTPVNTKTPTTTMASASASLKGCDKILNQCLIDATTFEEKQRCRAAHLACEERANFSTQTLMPKEQKFFGGSAGGAGGAGGPEASQTTECQPGKWCETPRDCAGEDCINGRCVCQPDYKICTPGQPCTPATVLKDCGSEATCTNGKCVCTDPNIKPCVEGAPCTDATKCNGGSCINGKCYCKSGSCVDDATCVRLHGAGWTCFRTAGSPRGICKPPKGPIPPGKCTPGKRCTGPEKNNSQCGGLKCFRPNFKGDETVPGTCYCNTGDGQDGDGGGGLGDYTYPSDLYKNTPGEYAYPAGMQELMSLLLGRGKELLGMPTGFSQEAMDKMFGLGFEKVRGTESAAREQMLQDLSRQGMSGTGTALGKTSDLAWNTENTISDLARTLFVANEEKKKQDLLDYTSAAQGIMGGGGLQYESTLEGINAGRRGETFNIEQLQEAINAARRGESTQAMMLLMQFLGILGG